MKHGFRKMIAMAAMAILILAGCSGPNDPKDKDTLVTFLKLEADGSETTMTTKLILTFDKDITGLTASDIFLDAGSTGAAKGALTRTGTGTYELAITGIITVDEDVTVTVSKTGYIITYGTKTVTVHHYVSPTDITVAFTNLTANGSETAMTTKLTLTFDKDIIDLSVSDVTLNVGSTGAIKGELTRTGTGIYELTIAGITASGSVTVAVSKTNYNITGGSKTAAVFYYVSPTDITVAFTNLTADGLETAMTTKLTLTFDKDITGLSVSDVILNAGSTGAIKGELTRTNTGTYELAIAGITASGSVTVTVSKTGYNITDSSKTAAVFYYVSPTDITVAFTKLTADGLETAMTTKLTLTFDKDIDDLNVLDIILNAGSTGAVKGELTRTNTGTYELAIAGITTSGSVTVTVSKTGYNITGGSKTAAVFYYVSSTDIIAAFTGLTADGSETTMTTKLTLTFDMDIDDLSVSDITLNAGSTGAVKGELTRIDTGIYELAVSDITVNGNVTVAVVKSGYNITGGSKAVAVYRSGIAVTQFEYYWVNEHDDLVTTSGGSTAVTAGRTITITAQSSGYTVKQWHVDSVNINTSGNTYNFSSIAVGKHTVGLFVEKDSKLYNTNIIITVEKPISHEVTISMFDSLGDGWGGNGALRINVNGADIATNVKVNTTNADNTPNGQRSTNTFTFIVAQRDIVQIYWVAGTNQDENSFIVYYSDTPPAPAFTASNNNTWNGDNALVYKLRNTMQTISNGALLGTFTVPVSKEE